MKYKKIFFIIVAIVFSLTNFVSCFSKNEIKKASKNLTSYQISASLDSENMVVSGNEKINVVNKTKTILNTLCFNLYGKAFNEGSNTKPWTQLNEGKCFPNGVNYGDMEIIEVKVNNENQEVKYNENGALTIDLKNELEPMDKILIELDFRLKLAECTHRLGYFKDSINLGNWFPILAVYENSEFITEPYYSTGDPFYSDIANYYVEFIYPKEYNISSSGAEETESFNQKENKSKIKAYAIRDFAVFFTKNSNIKKVKHDDVIISYIGYNTDENIDYALSVASKALKYFNKTFGEYPYKILDIVKAPFVHGGMEYPSVVIVADNITNEFDFAKVIVHEIAHQWWYGVVGNNQITEAWLDESLAEYSTILFLDDNKDFDVSYEELISEAFANYTLYADISSTLNKKINTNMLLKVNEYNSEYEYSYMIYVRGVLMFDSIRSVVGEENIKKAFKRYYSQYKFKIAKTDDLIAIFKKISRKNVDLVMDSWLNGKTVIGSI